MALYKDTGTNPFSSCLPILVQMPIFFALFRLLNHAAHDQARGVLTKSDVQHSEQRRHLRRQDRRHVHERDQPERSDPRRPARDRR